MNKLLQNLSILASTFISVSCNTSNNTTYAPKFSISPNIATNHTPFRTNSTFRGTPAFKKTSEYKLLRTKLLNTWMPIGELTEGFFPYIYRCSAGKPTVGIGTNMVGCSIPLSNIPLYTTTGKRLTTQQTKSWMAQTEGLSQSECRALARRLGYRGVSHADAERLAHKEAALKVDLVHDAMLKKHGMELFDQPMPIQVLILDLAYQRGHNGVFYNKGLWNCLKRRDYANAHKYVVCCTNRNRNTIKKALTKLAHCYKQGTDATTQLATLGRFNIRFNPSDLNRDTFTIANTDYNVQKTTPSSANRNFPNTTPSQPPKHTWRFRRG